jgi:hypothetical protein
MAIWRAKAGIHIIDVSRIDDNIANGRANAPRHRT